MGTNSAYTWRGQSTPEPSPAECFRSCIGNAEEAAKAETRARSWLEQAEREKTDLAQPKMAIAKAQAEQRHWRELANWHRKQVAAAGPMVPPPPEVVFVPAAVERQPGEDDGDEAPLSAWQDIGGVVRP